MAPGIVYPPASSERTPMCACADDDANWLGHGQTARLICTCGGTTVSAKGLSWAPRRRPAASAAERADHNCSWCQKPVPADEERFCEHCVAMFHPGCYHEHRCSGGT